MLKKIIKKFKNNYSWQAGSLIVLTAIVYSSLINNINLWLDEIYSVLMAKDSFSDMWVLLTTEDSKPPLYYLYLKFILWIFPKSIEIWAAHFASFILLIIAQIFAATEVRKDYGNKVALWLIFLLMFMPYSLWLAFEVRTYMLSSFLLMASVFYGARILDNPSIKDFIKFGLVSVLALYTHYYCVFFLIICYTGIFIYIISEKKFNLVGYKFIITSMIVGICFLPWIFVPLSTASEISEKWYVSLEFVKFSWQFFTNPLSPDIFQSVFHIATCFIASLFGFTLIFGAVNEKNNKVKKLFCLAFYSFVVCYALLLILSFVVRPMVTSRYLKIFSLILYMASALTLGNYKKLARPFGVMACICFCFTYLDIRAISFDRGYQNVINDVRSFISPTQPIIVSDNSNLFCEYYLPEYTCLLSPGLTGEILRKPKVMEKLPLYTKKIDTMIFSLSIYSKIQVNDGCELYNSDYRFGQNVNLCRYFPDTANRILDDSLIMFQNRNKRP